MKKYTLTATGALLVSSFLLTACGTSQEPDYFTLTSVSGEVKSDTAVSLKIERPVLPGYLDSLEFSRQIGANQILVDNTDYWAEPLDKMFAHILAEDVQQRLPASAIVTEDNYTASDARYTIDLNIAQFNLVDDARLSLAGNVIVKDRQNSSVFCAWPVQWSVASSTSPSSMVGGLSGLIGKLADYIAQNVPLACGSAAPHSISPAQSPPV